MSTTTGAESSSARTRCGGRPLVYDDVRTELVADLREIILDRERTASSSFPSLNVGGWKSGEGLFGWPHPAVEALRRVISRDFLGGAFVIGWAMVNRAGSHHPRHRHDGSVVSGIYCVDPGEPPSSPTIFEVRGAGDVAVAPAAGRLTLFPGDLWHRVPPYLGGRPRVTIAFDARR